MADFLLELRCEEIPARMQLKASEDLVRLFTEELAKSGLSLDSIDSFVTPRRLALIASRCSCGCLVEMRTHLERRSLRKRIAGCVSIGITILTRDSFPRTIPASSWEWEKLTCSGALRSAGRMEPGKSSEIFLRGIFVR